MNGMTPNCLDDFLFSNANDRSKLELILSRKLPFPYGGKSGILLHGTWGTGKTTLASLLPDLLEIAHAGTWDMNQGVGQMPVANPSHTQTEVFLCGGGLSSTAFTQRINLCNSRMPLWHSSGHDYFVFDEVDRLTIAAQQSLRATMGLKRCMFFFTTNYLSKVDPGIVNRCHLVEMNQVTVLSAYVGLGQSILANMGLASDALSHIELEAIASHARGSIRDYITNVILTGINCHSSFSTGG